MESLQDEKISLRGLLGGDLLKNFSLERIVQRNLKIVEGGISDGERSSGIGMLICQGVT
jgi:hypothetical protein